MYFLFFCRSLPLCHFFPEEKNKRHRWRPNMVYSAQELLQELSIRDRDGLQYLLPPRQRIANQIKSKTNLLLCVHMCTWRRNLMYPPVLKRGLLENQTFSSMIFPVIHLFSSRIFPLKPPFWRIFMGFPWVFQLATFHYQGVLQFVSAPACSWGRFAKLRPLGTKRTGCPSRRDAANVATGLSWTKRPAAVTLFSNWT